MFIAYWWDIIPNQLDVIRRVKPTTMALFMGFDGNIPATNGIPGGSGNLRY
jgi:hypothetical protein